MPEWKETEYSKKFRDPRWQKMRLQVFERDEFACQQCFDNESTLHVHHRWYGGPPGRDPWDYPLDALVTLCESCHEEETITLPAAADDLVQILKQCGAMSPQFNELFMALRPTVDAGAVLDEYDWSVVQFALQELLASWGQRGELWNQTRERFVALCAERAERRRQTESGSEPT